MSYIIQIRNTSICPKIYLDHELYVVRIDHTDHTDHTDHADHTGHLSEV